MALSLHEKAPDFTLPATGNKNITLSKDFEGQPLILYFYPKDFTPGCTTEACSFRDTILSLKDVAINIIGISKDDILTHERFKKIHNLPFDLLSDLSGEVIKKYDAMLPILNIVKRVTYVLDENHTIIGIYQNMFDAKSHVSRMTSIYQKHLSK